MINFFRRIRKRFLSENKLSKYLIYAIGEIVLVMIGILLALQVNTWNEARKAKIQEVKILKQLNSDLNENLKQVKFHIRFESNRIRHIDSILIHLNNKRDVNGSFMTLLTKIKQSLILRTTNTTYKYIESNGMNILSNDSLRAFITKIYDERLHTIEQRNIVQSENIRLKLLPYMQVHFKPAMVNGFPNRPYRPSTNPINMENLWNNFEFQNLLLEIKFYAEDYKQVLGYSEFGVNKLIQNIETEIKKLEH